MSTFSCFFQLQALTGLPSTGNTQMNPTLKGVP